MKRISLLLLSLTLTASLFVGCGNNNTENKDANTQTSSESSSETQSEAVSKDISIDESKKLINDGEVTLILDVRNEDEFAEGHLKNAIQIPVKELKENLSDIEKFKEEVNDDTILISLIYVHNELGTVNKVKELFEIAKAKNKDILCHVDGVQAVGKIPVNVKDLGCDTLSFSSHKIYGPKGMGALYKRRDLNIESLVIGGGQEKGLRSGTENVPGILGFGKACELTKRDLEKRLSHAKEIKDYLLKKLEENLEDYKINTPENSTDFIVSLSILDIRAEVLLHYLEGDEIYISTASACTSNGTHKSTTLKAIGLSDKYSEGTIRICTSKDTTKEDIDIFVEKLLKYVNEIRKIMR